MRVSARTIQRLTDIITGNTEQSPYSSGPELIEFFRDFGERDLYGQGFPSRAHYVQEKLRKFNGTETLEQIVSVAFDFFGDDAFNPEEQAEAFNRLLVRDGYRLVIEYRSGWMQGDRYVEADPYFAVQPTLPAASIPEGLVAISHPAVNEQVSKANIRRRPASGTRMARSQCAFVRVESRRCAGTWSRGGRASRWRSRFVFANVFPRWVNHSHPITESVDEPELIHGGFVPANIGRVNSMPKPNLFDYAYKELSQDAVICWLIKWSGTQSEDAPEQALRDLGHAFVEALLAKHGAALAGSVRCAEIHQQNLGIDVLARVRDEQMSHVLLIEDKTYTDRHSGQLKRYYNQVVNGGSALGNVDESSVRPVFLKTGNQSRYKDGRIESESRYKVFGRKNFLDVLDRFPGDHPIVTDFRDHLRRRETAFTECSDWGRNDDRSGWSWEAWEGLYRCLEESLDADWGYVSNRRGGFVGFWWHWKETTAGDWFFLQLEIEPWDSERQKLCFKVEREDASDDMRDEYHNAILATGAGAVVRPARMRRGKTMTVGVWEGDWLAFSADRRLDINGTVENLKKAERIVDAAASST